MALINGGCLITLSLHSNICVDAASDCRCVQVRVVIAMIAVTSYERMSVDDLQMLGVHVKRGPNQGQERQTRL